MKEELQRITEAEKEARTIVERAEAEAVIIAREGERKAAQEIEEGILEAQRESERFFSQRVSQAKQKSQEELDFLRRDLENTPWIPKEELRQAIDLVKQRLLPPSIGRSTEIERKGS